MRSPRGVIFCKCMCAWQPVRVVDGDGRVRSLNHPVTVGELVEWHPHHFVCEPTTKAPLYHTAMLPLDMKLEEGRIYLLLPLPRLLPHLSNSFSEPPSCPCFQSHPQAAAHAAVTAPAANSSFIAQQQAAAQAQIVLNPSKNKEGGSLIHAATSDVIPPAPSKAGIKIDTATRSNAAPQKATTRISECFNISKNGALRDEDCKNLPAARTEQSADSEAQQQQQQEAKQAGSFMSPMLMTSLVHLVKKLLSSLIPFSTKVEEFQGRGGARDGLDQMKLAAAGFQCSMRNRWRPALECISELDSLAAHSLVTAPQPSC